MLDISKLLFQLENAKIALFADNKDDVSFLYKHWIELCKDSMLIKKVANKRFGLLLPSWQEDFAATFPIIPLHDNYAFLAVDGSQVYYDRHQGPACYLINIGSCFISYSKPVSRVQCSSTPLVSAIAQDEEKNQGFIDLKREELELQSAVALSKQFYTPNLPFLCCFDGSLIFWSLEGLQEDEHGFLPRYFDALQGLYEQKIPYAGYVSYPRNKDLINVLKLYAVDFKEDLLHILPAAVQGLVDTDIVEWYLPEGFRSQVFESKASICYVYPAHLKPYFCYLHVGQEIIRMEFPAWIAKDSSMVTQICQMAYDQALKGRGYPVCLFEAHEQAVIKQQDRQLFYHALQMIGMQQAKKYVFSQKSLKKRQVDL